MNLSLEGKTAVVCGSSQGIGLAVAQELAQLGANCILIARDAKKLGIAMNSLQNSVHQHHSFIVADFTNSEAVRIAIDTVLQHGPLEILVNNTGGPAAGPITDAKEDEFTAAFNQHLVNNHILTKAVVPGMKRRKYGRIINIISTSVKVPLPNLGVSNTIRAAVASWAKSMANELGQFNITVNNILPGYTETKRLESLLAATAKKKKQTIEQTRTEMMKDIPLRRFGTAAEIGSVAAFLASPAAAYVSGANIAVDGGRTGSL
ncbi:MAG TPA: SDR family oxidoreductase [Chitinophagaceae bacterium]|nr:SDR family oxidoreductase [Chitinophagaceae bacterium]